MIIGMTGLAGSGKSTVAMMLHTKLSFHRLKFAGPLKAMLCALGLSDIHIEGSYKDQPCPLLCGRTPRYAMQTLGTEWGRQLIGESLWVRAAMHEAQDWRNAVFDDVRFPNEAVAVKAARGVIWRIERPGLQPVEAHASESEQAAIQPDAILTNNGSILQLQEAVLALYYEQTTDSA